MKTVSLFLVAVALIVGMVGCEGNGSGDSYTLAITSTAGGSVTVPGEGFLPTIREPWSVW